MTFEQISDNLDQPAAKLLKAVVYNVTLKIVVRQDLSQSHSSDEPTTTSLVPTEADERHDTSDPRLSDSDVSILLEYPADLSFLKRTNLYKRVYRSYREQIGIRNTKLEKG